MQKNILKERRAIYAGQKSNIVMQTVFDAFKRYKLYKTHFKIKNAEALFMNQLTSKKKVVYSLLRNKAEREYYRELTRQVELKMKHKFLGRWIDNYNEFVDTKPYLEMAEQFYVRKCFSRFMMELA